MFTTLDKSDVNVMLDIYSTPRQLQDAFIGALNAVVTDTTSIYNATAFTGVTLSSATTALMAQNPTQTAQLDRQCDHAQA